MFLCRELAERMKFAVVVAVAELPAVAAVALSSVAACVTFHCKIKYLSLSYL